MRDYYYILGVDEKVSEQEIKTAYRKLSLKFHPDKNDGEKFFEERFKEIQEAYETLSNSVKRKEYNVRLNQFRSSRINRDNLKDVEDELKRKFEEEYRKREEEIKRKYQTRENRIKEDAENQIRNETFEPDQTLNREIGKKKNNTLVYLFFGIVLLAAISIYQSNKQASPEINNSPKDSENYSEPNVTTELVFKGNQKIKKHDPITDNLNGKINTFVETKYTTIETFGEMQKDKMVFKLILKYDEKGNRTEQSDYYEVGRLDNKHIWNYDNEGKIIEHNEYEKDGSLVIKHFLKYDDKGNVIEENAYNEDGSLRYKYTSKYDLNGNKIELNNFLGEDSLYRKWTFKYDDKGNQIEENVFQADSYSDKTTSKYDTDGNKIEENKINSKWGSSKNIYKYDDKGNVVEDNYYNKDGKLLHKWTSKYDDRGNIIEGNRYNENGSQDLKTTFKYEYDKRGNWLKKIVCHDDTPKEITEREIEYY